MNKSIERGIRFLQKSNTIVVGAGAGMGKDSGLPDFRGNEGFWNSYPPYRHKFDFYECANPNFLLQEPHLFWGFYGSRLQMYRQKQPHKGFQYLKDIAESINKKSTPNIFAVTSNVDGHFQKARYDEHCIYQVHGSIHYLQCNSCQTLIDNNFQPDIDESTMSCRNLPSCSKCNEVLRPNILMFNDWDWMQERQSPQRMKFARYEAISKNQPIVIIEIGCGTAVPTIRNLMEQIYYRNKQSRLIRINMDPETSAAKQFDQSRYIDIHMSAEEALRLLSECL